MSRPTRYPPHFRADAIVRVKRIRPAHDSEWAAIRTVANELAISAETLRTWIRQAERTHPAGRPRPQQTELHRLIRENAELRRALGFLVATHPPAKRGRTEDARTSGG